MVESFGQRELSSGVEIDPGQAADLNKRAVQVPRMEQWLVITVADREHANAACQLHQPHGEQDPRREQQLARRDHDALDPRPHRPHARYAVAGISLRRMAGPIAAAHRKRMLDSPMTASPDRENNFDLLRLVFASSVFFWHLYLLSQAPALEIFSQLFSASLAVKGFFVISGYLVMMSWENSSSLREYAEKRARRIYPAYAAVVLACAVAGVFVTALPLAEYFDARVLRYLAANLVFLNFLAPTLPGVFEGQSYTEVNGALWTLKIEVMYYAFVPVLAWMLARFGRWRVMVVLYMLAVVYSAVMGELHARTGAGFWLQLQRQLPGQLGYFLVGVALYFARDRLRGRWGALVAAALVMLVLIRASADPVITVLLEPLALGVVVVFAATAIPHLGNFARYGDFSYGVYIIHFPVVQGLVASGMFAANPWTAFWTSLALVAALSVLCWHAVERPFLRRRSHYRLAENRGATET